MSIVYANTKNKIGKNKKYDQFEITHENISLKKKQILTVRLIKDAHAALINVVIIIIVISMQQMQINDRAIRLRSDSCEKRTALNISFDNCFIFETCLRSTFLLKRVALYVSPISTVFYCATFPKKTCLESMYYSRAKDPIIYSKSVPH